MCYTNGGREKPKCDTEVVTEFPETLERKHYLDVQWSIQKPGLLNYLMTLLKCMGIKTKQNTETHQG